MEWFGPGGSDLHLFKARFTLANELHITALTSADLKFADANAATYLAAATQLVTPPCITTPVPATMGVSVAGVCMYYCWSHGLGTSEHHTSAACRQPREGHIRDATVTKRQGGSNIFVTKEDRAPRPSSVHM
jgi:hypothetical protein